MKPTTKESWVRFLTVENQFFLYTVNQILVESLGLFIYYYFSTKTLINLSTEIRCSASDFGRKVDFFQPQRKTLVLSTITDAMHRIVVEGNRVKCKKINYGKRII